MRILILITDPQMSGLWLNYVNHVPAVPDRLYIGQIYAYETPPYRATELYQKEVGESWPNAFQPLPLLHPDLTKFVTGIRGETHVFLAVREGKTMPRPSWKFRDLVHLKNMMSDQERHMQSVLVNSYAFRAGVCVLESLRAAGGLK